MRFHPSAVRSFLEVEEFSLEGLAFGFALTIFLASGALGFFLKKREIICIPYVVIKSY